MMLIHLGCATKKESVTSDRGVVAGQWNRLAADCVEQEVSPAVYTCTKEVLATTYDWMVDAFYDLQEYKAKLATEQRRVDDAKAADRGNNLYWLGGGFAGGAHVPGRAGARRAVGGEGIRD